MWVLILVGLLGLLILILYGSMLSYHYNNGKKLPLLKNNLAFLAETPINVLRTIIKNQKNIDLTMSEENRFEKKVLIFTVIKI